MMRALDTRCGKKSSVFFLKISHVVEQRTEERSRRAVAILQCDTQLSSAIDPRTQTRKSLDPPIVGKHTT